MNPKENPDAGSKREDPKFQTSAIQKRGSKAPNLSYKKSESCHQKKCNQTHKPEDMHLTLNEHKPEYLEGEQGRLKKKPPKEPTESGNKAEDPQGKIRITTEKNGSGHKAKQKYQSES